LVIKKSFKYKNITKCSLIFLTLLCIFILIPFTSYNSKIIPTQTNNLNQNNLKLRDLDSKYDYDSNIFSSSQRYINFSGYEWIVRTSNGNLEGPGPNLFNDSINNIWLDENGFLHLKITKSMDTWYCAEVYSVESFGYGTYSFKLKSGFENIDINVVLGLFTYLDDTHEIDIEFSKWGYVNNLNGQYVVQPYYIEGNVHRFDMDSQNNTSIHSFTWCENYISFSSEIGNEFGSDSNIKVDDWIYLGNSIPKNSTEKVHINLWLMNGLPPSDNKEYEVIIEEFKFIPDPCSELVDKRIDGYFYPYMISITLIALIAVVVIYTKSNKIKII